MYSCAALSPFGVPLPLGISQRSCGDLPKHVQAPHHGRDCWEFVAQGGLALLYKRGLSSCLGIWFAHQKCCLLGDRGLAGVRTCSAQKRTLVLPAKVPFTSSAASYRPSHTVPLKRFLCLLYSQVTRL